MYRIDEHTRHRIVHMWEDGVRKSDIALELGVTRNTVNLWIQRFERQGNVDTHVSLGRPKKTTQDVDLQIVDHVRQRRFVNTTEMSATFGVSRQTIRRRCRAAGLRHRIPARKPFLTHRHKALRLNFATTYLNYDFQNVVFMDEKVFMSSADGRMSLYRMNSTRYHEQNVLPNRRSSRISCGFWGWMHAAGPGEISEVSGRMNSRGYIEILNEVFLPTVHNVVPSEMVYFMQDNSSVHSSRMVRNWIDRQTNLELIKMPPRSPDLNPIENLWGLMVQDWNPLQARTTPNLKNHVHELWDSFRGTNICQNLVNSMNERLQDVINAEGAYTRF